MPVLAGGGDAMVTGVPPPFIRQQQHNGGFPNQQPDQMATVEDDGWDFWSRVYEDPDLRQELSQKAQNGPTVSELLRSDELCRGELVFLNVPRIGTGQQAIVRSLLNTQLGRNLPLLDIAITNRRWRVRFYRHEDAIEVQRRFDGFRFKQKCLIVRHSGGTADTEYPQLLEKLQMLGFGGGSTPAIPPHPAMVPNMQAVASKLSAVFPTQPVAIPRCTVPPPTPPPAPAPEPRPLDPTWTPAELDDIEAFKNEVIGKLTCFPDGFPSTFLIDELRTMRRRGFVAVALDSWSTGLLRLCAPQVRLTGKYVSLASQNNYRALLSKTIGEGSARIPSDEWEPMPPANVRNDYHLIDYMTAFLTQFGPQHCKVDLPIRMLARSLPGQWPMSAVSLCQQLSTMSSSFLLFDDVLYLATNVRHRRVLLDQLVPPKPPRYSARHFAQVSAEAPDTATTGAHHGQ